MTTITAENVDQVIAAHNAKIAKLKAKPFTKEQQEAIYLVYLELVDIGDWDNMSEAGQDVLCNIINAE